MVRSPDAAGWLVIFRLGLVQTALGAVVVLATSTLNRVMIVEFALPATVPGALIAFHYAIQMARPRFGHGSDVGGRRTPWIIGGLALLAVGGTGAALATALLASDRGLGLVLAGGSYALIGLGVGAAGTSLLALLAKRVEPRRRAAAATTLWIMLIAGFAITSAVAGHFLDPFSPQRLVAVTAAAAAIAFTIGTLALLRLERSDGHGAPAAANRDFGAALREVWSEPHTRRFTIFVAASMLAYSAEELVLEPFGARVFGLTPGASAQLSGAMHGGAVAGMLLVAVMASVLRIGSLRAWVVAGCAASAAALLALGAGGLAGPGWPVGAFAFALGLANGMFTVAAIGSMMELAGRAGDGREGVRMGLWGGAQAVAFAAGGLAGTGAIDLTGHLFTTPASAYAGVFAAEALLFMAAARLAWTLDHPHHAAGPTILTATVPQGDPRARREVTAHG